MKNQILMPFLSGIHPVLPTVSASPVRGDPFRARQDITCASTRFASPTQAARRVATLDNLIEGRLWLHIITGGVDADQRRDGDYTPR